MRAVAICRRTIQFAETPRTDVISVREPAESEEENCRDRGGGIIGCEGIVEIDQKSWITKERLQLHTTIDTILGPPYPPYN